MAFRAARALPNGMRNMNPFSDATSRQLLLSRLSESSRGIFSGSRAGSALRFAPAAGASGVGGTSPFSGPSWAQAAALDPHSQSRRQFSSTHGLRADGKFNVFFGSQTGTAQMFAKDLRKAARGKKLKAKVVDLDGFDPATVQGMIAEDEPLVFMLACYGKGEPTDNAVDFYNWLMSDDRTADELAGAKYSVFGLGNQETYPERYQAVGRAVDKRLTELGGVRMLPLGEGDDSGTMDDDFDSWMDKFWPVIGKAAFGEAIDPASAEAADSPAAVGTGAAAPCEDDAKAKLPPRYTPALQVISHGHTDLPPHRLKPSEEALRRAMRYQHRPVTQNLELQNEGSDRSTRHIEIDIHASGLTYTAGDHLGVLASNSPSRVSQLGKLLGVDLDVFVTVTSTDEDVDSPFPAPITLRDLFTNHVDIHNPPSIGMLRQLASLTDDQSDQDGLLQLASRDHYTAWVRGNMPSIVDVLQKFPSLAGSVSVDTIVDLLPQNAPRMYSISSSPKVNPDVVTLTVAVDRHPIPDADPGRFFLGQCSSYLSRIPEDDWMGNTVSVYVRESDFRLPEDLSSNMVFIGAGSGLAPIRGFVQELTHEKIKNGATLGKNTLIFGCRHEAFDFIYEKELKQAVTDGVLDEIVPAFSHDQEEMIFVQHKVEERQNEIWDTLNNGGYLYVCGDMKGMARGVEEALSIMSKDHLGSSEAADAWIKNLRDCGRFQEDVF